jgi:hypothetical protein
MAFSINVKAGVTKRGDVDPGFTDAVRLKQLKDMCSAFLMEDPFPAIDFRMPQQDEQVFTEYIDHCLARLTRRQVQVHLWEGGAAFCLSADFQPLLADLREFVDVMKGDQFAY